MKKNFHYLRMILIAALIAAIGIVVYMTYTTADRDRQRLDQDQELIQQMFEEQKRSVKEQ